MAAQVEALGKGYAIAVRDMCSRWAYNCDGGCFMGTLEKVHWTEGPYMWIYQPHKSMIDYEDFVASIFVRPVKALGGQPISEDLWARFRDTAKKQVEQALVDSFMDYVTWTNGKWLSSLKDIAFESIVQIRRPLERMPDGSLKMSFEIRGAESGCCGDTWWPFRLTERLLDEPRPKDCCLDLPFESFDPDEYGPARGFVFDVPGFVPTQNHQATGPYTRTRSKTRALQKA